MSKALLLLLASTRTARLLRKPKTQKPNFARMLVGISSSIKANLTAQLTGGTAPEFATDIFGCALSIKNGMEDLRLSYTEVHVPTVVGQACDFSNVYLELGKSREKCNALTTALTEEWSADQNYHRWCRKVAASESESMMNAMKKIESDAESKKLLASCQKVCPKMANIIKHGAAMTELFTQIMQPPPPGSTFEDMIKTMTEQMRKLGTQHNSICDQQKEAKCTLSDMHGDCSALFQKIELPIAMVDEMITQCNEIEPCKTACHGVVEKQQDFEIKSFLEMFSGATLSDGVTDLCESFHRLNECYEKPACKTVLSHFEYSKEPMTKRCEVVDHPCFSKITKSCKKETDNFFGKHGNGDAWDQKTCTDKFQPWSKTTTPEEKKKCCEQFGSLGKCAKDLKCEETLEKFMYVTPDPQWSQGKIVECTCQSQWEKNFGGSACPGTE